MKNKKKFNSQKEALDYYAQLGISNPTLYDPSQGSIAQKKGGKYSKKMGVTKEGRDSLLDYQLDYNIDHNKGGVDRMLAYGGTIQDTVMGGQMNYKPGQDIEVEGGESALDVQGQTTEFEGPSHAQGGIPVNTADVSSDPNNDKLDIYSDKFGPDGKKGPTFSDLNKKLGKKVSKYDEIIDDPAATPTAIKTAKLMKDKYIGKQESLFNDQESYKAAHGMNKPNKKFAVGGNTDGNNITQAVQSMNRGNSPYADEFIPGGLDEALAMSNQYTDAAMSSFMDAPMGVDSFGMNGNDMSAVNALEDGLQANSANLPGGASSLMDKLGGIGGMASMLPGLVNIGRGLFEKADTMDPSDYTTTAPTVRAQKYNFDPALRAADRSRQVADYNVKNAANTRGELMGGYSANAAGDTRNRADIYSQGANMNAQYQQQADMANAQFRQSNDARNSQLRQNVNNYNAQSFANKSNMTMQGLGQLSGAVQNQQLQSNMAGVDKYKAYLLSQMFPEQNFNMN